jgi:small subunit ribosomal protein S6e
MVEFKIVVSDPKTGRAYNVDASGGAAGTIVGKRIGDELDAGTLGLAGYKIKITGASDRTGTTAKKGLPGAGRKKLLLAGGIGFHPSMDGERRRKTIRSTRSPRILSRSMPASPLMAKRPLMSSSRKSRERRKPKRSQRSENNISFLEITFP